MIQIALDAMGGDNAPQSEVHGAVLAAQELQIGVTLVGDRKQIEHELKKYPTEGLSIDIIHASQVISMRESVTVALLKKKDSSIRVATHLVREGQVSGIVSAGNTGASLATAKLILGVLDTVDRPALAALLSRTSNIRLGFTPAFFASTIPSMKPCIILQRTRFCESFACNPIPCLPQ